MNAGSKTVRMGTESDRCSSWPLSRLCRSFVFSIMATATRKLLHSTMMLVGLNMLMPNPYHVDVIGQSSWVSPIMKSPTRLCWASAMK